MCDFLSYRPKWIKLGNIEYRPGAIIFVAFEGVLPKFVVVKDILLINSKPFLTVSECLTLGLDEHYRSYVISMYDNGSPEVLYNLHDLPDYSVMHSHQSFSQTDHQLYVCLKWSIENI